MHIVDDGGSTADATTQVLIYGMEKGGSFVIGDKNGAAGTSVTFWGAPAQVRDETAMNVARVWGDLLGVEVSVCTLRGRQLRVEVVFNSAEAALAVGGRQAEAVARGSKRR